MTNLHRGQSSFVPASRLSAADFAGMAVLVCVLMLVSYLRSRNCAFWGDEILGVEVLERPTYASLLDFWRHGIDSSGIWFYVFGRPWAALFGFSEVSLRMYSAVAVAASAVVMWIASRRFYRVLPVAAGVSMVYAFLAPLHWQLANGRTYGLLMLAVALMIYLLLAGEDDQQRGPTGLFLFATLAAYALLAGSHVLGSLYVAAFLAIQLALDLRRRRFRPLLYVSAACSLMVIWFSRANIEAMVAVGKPSFWTVQPSWRDFLAVNHMIGNRLSAALAFLFLLGLIHLRPRRTRMPAYVLLGSFAVLDLIIFLYSRHATSIYVDRYLLPFAVALILLFCELFTQLQEADAPWGRLRKRLPAAFIVFAAMGFFLPRLQTVFLPFPDYTLRLLASLPSGLPVIDTDVASFREVQFYRHDALSQPFLFPVDWEVALDPETKGGVSGFHEMDRAKLMGIHAEDIQPTSQILENKKDFLVLSNPNSPVWLQRRILANPAYIAEKVSTFQGDPLVAVDIWNVHTK